MRISVTRYGQRIVLAAPYCPDLPERARELGGRWDRITRSWSFNAKDETRVRKMLRSIYGTDGSDNPEMVTVRVTITSREAGQSAIWLAGRAIAQRRNRDWPVQLGEDVVVISGGFPRIGGSKKHPELGGKGTVLEVRDVPRRAVPQAPNIEIVDDDNGAHEAQDNGASGVSGNQ